MKISYRIFKLMDRCDLKVDKAYLNGALVDRVELREIADQEERVARGKVKKMEVQMVEKVDLRALELQMADKVDLKEI